MFDLYQRSFPADRPPPGMIVIAVDDESLRRVGRWPWPRDRLADLLDHLARARVIGVDIILSEPDQAGSPGPSGSAAPWSGSDVRLSERIRDVPVVLAVAADSSNPGRSPPPPGFPLALLAESPLYANLPQYRSALWPLPIFARAAQGMGTITVRPEPDGVIRQLPGVVLVGNIVVPGFAVEVARLAVHAAQVRAEFGLLGVSQLWLGQTPITTGAQGEIRLRYAATGAVEIIPAYAVLDGLVSADRFTDRIILLGVTASGVASVFATPLHSPLTGVMVHAQAVESILAADLLWRPPFAAASEALLTALLGLWTVALFGRLADRRYALLTGGLVVALVTGSVIAFVWSHTLLDWTLPVLGLLLTNGVSLLIRSISERRAGRSRDVALASALRAVDAARRITQQAEVSAKLATLGELATGIAHELNQPVTVISLAAENADAALEDGADGIEEARDRLGLILRQTERARSIVGHLKVFGRSDAGPLAPIDIATAIQGALVLVGPSLMADMVRVDVREPVGLPLVAGRQVPIEQVIVNLLMNARDALLEKPPPERIVWLHASTIEQGRSVQVTVRDNGPGIPADVMPHLFEPFFTTKPAGQGTGLGLSICHGIMDSMSGRLAATNIPGGGAEFIMTLRAAEADEIARSTERTANQGKPRNM